MSRAKKLSALRDYSVSRGQIPKREARSSVWARADLGLVRTYRTAMCFGQGELIRKRLSLLHEDKDYSELKRKRSNNGSSRYLSKKPINPCIKEA